MVLEVKKIEAVHKLTPIDLEIMRIPARYHLSSIDFIRDEEMRSKMERIYDVFIENEKPGFGAFFRGGFSNGKTYNACAILKRMKAMKAGFRGLFVDAREMDDDFMRSEFMSENKRMEERMKEVDLLVLDDLGSEKKYEADNVFDIFKFRANNLKRTIVTTNLIDQTSFVKAYSFGEKFWDLIGGCSLIVTFTSDDNYRLQENREATKG